VVLTQRMRRPTVEAAKTSKLDGGAPAADPRDIVALGWPIRSRDVWSHTYLKWRR
jgi:hypothetical protein